MEYIVNGDTLRYSVSNDVERGADVVLINSATDLTSDQPWHSQGYVIHNLFENKDDFTLFKSSCVELLYRCWRDAGLSVPDNFPVDQYHHLTIRRSDHLAAIERTKLLSVDDFPIPLSKITDRVSKILGRSVEGLNPFDGERIFHFRVVRPRSGDNNPLHRDVWLEDYANCINLYIPIAGSNERSSLIILPGSHLWSESRLIRTVDGAVINGVRFNVPAVESIDGSYVVLRPNPGPGEFLLFSPYLVHGGSTNFNDDKTRISIELRLWPVNPKI